MTITSDAVQADGTINSQYTCDGTNISPPLTFSGIPAGTQSLAFVMEDPDAPGQVFTHWLLYDMSPATLQLVEGRAPMTGKSGLNDFGLTGYGGPCPPQGSHRYVFTLHALDTVLELPEGVSKDELQQAIDTHIIETASLTGTYARSTEA